MYVQNLDDDLRKNIGQEENKVSFNYDRDCPFETFITNLGKYNEGELIGEWLKFPTTPEELQNVFERIGIGSKDEYGNSYEEWFISDYDCYVDGLASKLGEYENLEELNYLASELEELGDYEYLHFQAAMQVSDYTNSIKDLINLVDNLDKYDVYPDTFSHEDLGRYCIEELHALKVPENLLNYIDYEAYGRDVALEESGDFTDYGYVRDTQDTFQEYYDGDLKNIPEEYRLFNHSETVNEKKRENMDYENFKENFIEDVRKGLYERGIEDVNITTQQTTKLNESYESIAITPEGSNIGINTSLEMFFRAVEDGQDYNEVVQRAVNTFADGIKQTPSIDVSSLTDYSQMKDKLVMEVVGTDTNKTLLSDVPHKDMEDLSVVYRFVMENNEDSRASIVVTNHMLDVMGVNPEQLHADAMENAPQLKPVVITGMNEIMVEMMGREEAEMMGIPLDEEDHMFVATVPDKIHGAGVLAYENFMEEAAERVGGSFFILPSSLHEILIIPDDGNADLHELESMVREVNSTQVAPEERLSDNVYHYDAQEKLFELGEKFVERQNEKEAAMEEKKADKESVLGDLKAKKDEVAKQPKKEAVEKVAGKDKGGEAI